MTTALNVLDRARGHIHVGSDDELNRLAAAYTSGGTTLTMEFPLGGIQRGVKLGVELEEFHVWSVSGLVATVSGAQNGSTAANHASGTLVRVNPTVSDYRMFLALNEELDALSGRGLVRVRQVNLTGTASTIGYDLTGTTTVLDVRQVKRETVGATKNWPLLRRSQFRLDTGQDTSEFASGNALMVYAGVDVGQKIRVWYDAPLTNVTALADDIESVTGLHAEAHDILSLGVAIRVMAGLPFRRASLGAQGDPRRAEEVSTGDTLNSPSRLKSIYDHRIQEEMARLDIRYPRTA